MRRSLTGKLGSYTDKEDGFEITITSNDVGGYATPRAGQKCTEVLPVKRVAIFCRKMILDSKN